jgi:hypothetical protein
MNTYSITEDTVALPSGAAGKDTRSSSVSVEPLYDSTLLIVLRVQANVTVALRLGDYNRCLFGVKISLARSALRWVAADGGTGATSCEGYRFRNSLWRVKILKQVLTHASGSDIEGDGS